MKDITIKGRRIKRELAVLLVSFIVANLLNVLAIIRYDAKWTELVSTLHITIALSIVLYLVAGVFRLLIALVKRVLARA